MRQLPTLISNRDPALEDLVKHHLLQVADPRQLELHHQLFQEYYAAEWLLERVSRLGDGELKREFLNFLKWTEPVALVLALVEEGALAGRVVRLGLEVDLMLGARLAGEVKPQFQTKTVLLSTPVRDDRHPPRPPRRTRLRNLTSTAEPRMSNPSRYNFPNVQKVQIFEQVDQYIEHNYPANLEVKSTIVDLQTLFTQLQAQHPHITTQSQALPILDAEVTDIKQGKIPRFAALGKQLLNPERHLQALRAALGEIAKHYLEDSVWAKTTITYLDKLSEEPNHGA